MNSVKNQNEESAKEVIVRASLELFAKKGYDGVTVRDIAQKTGLNLSLVSYYFGGKEGLYQEILGRVVESFESMLSGKIAFYFYRGVNAENGQSLFGQGVSSRTY
jgi:AcrR family transcriptional regulator